jgi:hypothetical protein
LPAQPPVQFEMVIDPKTAKAARHWSAVELSVHLEEVIEQRDVCVWHKADLQQCLLFGRYRGQSRRGPDGPKSTRMTQSGRRDRDGAYLEII